MLDPKFDRHQKREQAPARPVGSLPGQEPAGVEDPGAATGERKRREDLQVAAELDGYRKILSCTTRRLPK